MSQADRNSIIMLCNAAYEEGKKSVSKKVEIFIDLKKKEIEKTRPKCDLRHSDYLDGYEYALREIKEQVLEKADNEWI